MLKSSRQPYGFRDLLVYQKTEELQSECSLLTSHFPHLKTLFSLADQMNRSARSTKQNIVEGWKRNSTKEYYDFLGFSIGACAELEEDCNDIWKGFYPDLKGLKGIMGERGNPSNPSNPPSSLSSLNPLSPLDPLNISPQSHFNNFYSIPSNAHFDNSHSSNPSNPLIPSNNSHSSNPSNPLIPFDIEKLKFYPLDRTLPPIIQLKLRCKEINFLLHKLQKSLEEKMKTEGTLTISDKFKIQKEEISQDSKAEENLLKNFGFSRLENGKIVEIEKTNE